MLHLGMETQYTTTDFDKLEKAFGNRYAAVMWLAEETRRLENLTKRYNIPESKMITWALTGKCPYSDLEMELRKKPKLNDKLDLILEYVTDTEVKDAVKLNYKLSVRNRRLILCNNADLGEHRVVRVNILLQMAWNNFI